MSHRGRVLVIEESPRAETGRLWDGIRAEGWEVHALPLDRILDDRRTTRPDVMVLDLAGTRNPAERTRYLDAAARMSLMRGAHRVPVLAVDGDAPGSPRAIGIAETIRTPWSVGHVAARIGSLSRLATMRTEIGRRLDTAGRFGVAAPEPDLGGGAIDAHVLVVGAGIRYFTIERALSKRATLIGAFTIETALDYLERRSFDAVVLNLPLDEAAEFATLLRRNPDHFAVPIIALTGETERRLIEQMHEAGASDVILATEGEAVFAERVEAAMAEHRLHVALKAAYAGTRHPATNDALTGLYGRGFLMDHLETLVADARDDGDRLSMIGFRVLDLGDFNAEWGWAGGDQLLRQVGMMIGRLVRGEDLAARAGGDRFAVVLPATDGDDAAVVAHRIAGVIETTAFAVNGATGPIYATLAVGVGEIEPDDTAESLAARCFTID
ncbi:diguanylate cyclase [Siculibacillus lacustris]|uniref:diguanylate cyclase n=1 Tax=Siculibacillus lacustris TaxID=1549641 RepID=A0A4Q9VFD1_9HYPH|nr:diguanylate cyclase [Siculibacillus lacustris]TBW33017.1 diguanylate cyclase [Siculibacillus lacustris]